MAALRGQTGRDAYLDGLRALAIGSVLALHWLAWYVPLFHGGSVGVDVFFVLSGFVITSVLWRTSPGTGLARGWLAFVRRRLLRLYPALLGLVIGSVLLWAALPFAPLPPAEVGRRGLLVLAQATAFWAAGQSGSLWLPALHPFAQTWSLAIEWYFYLLWPLVVLVARTRGVSPRRLAVGSLVAALTCFAVSVPLSAFWFYFSPPARFAELLVGAAVAFWVRAGGVTPYRAATAVQVVALAAVATYALLGPGGDSSLYRNVGVPLTTLATAALIHGGYAAPGGLVHRLLGHPWLAALGRHSYSLYLWHVVPMVLLEDAWPTVPKPVTGLVAVAAAAVLTLFSYRYLERPFLRSRSDALAAPAPVASGQVTRTGSR